MTNITLHNGDCIEYMRTLPDSVFDLTVTSPPYDNLRTYGKDFDAAKFDWRTIIAELYRVTKTGGVVVWVVADATIKGSETGTSFRQALWAMECGFNLHDTMIYGKENPPPQFMTGRYTQSFDYMFVLSKAKPVKANLITEQCKFAGVSRKTKGIRKPNGEFYLNRSDDHLHKESKILSNVWSFGVGGTSSGHPAPFPESLARDHILSWSNVGDTVFDPMMGSGTTGKMAKLHGRNFVGCELDAGYYEIARQRIEAAQVQPTLLEVTG